MEKRQRRAQRGVLLPQPSGEAPAPSGVSLRWRDGFLSSSSLIRKQASAVRRAGGGARPVRGRGEGKIDDVSVTRRVETHAPVSARQRAACSAAQTPGLM